MKFGITLITLGAVLIFTGDAYAYLDAGTGSYMLQMLLATVAAGMFAIKHYWKKLKGFFSSKSEVDEKID